MARWIGRYELRGPIGKGGMAELHLARVEGAIEGAHKLCVVKQMLPSLADDAQFVQMFVDEAKLALGLDHPNIVHVHDVGCVAGRYFFAMEYLHGETVARIQTTARQRKERVPLAEALSICVGVAAGLHYAHDKKAQDGTPLAIVHRDVSPQNVIVTFDGAVKLLDFGIAKAAQRETETRQGTIKGKVKYMSPEQIRGEPLDRRADVFALGVMLWELTTGRTLYEGDGEFQIQRQIVDADARAPSSVVSDYPAELEPVVMKALARVREDRYESAEALQLAMEELAREQKLSLSSVGLSRYLRERFSDRAEAMRLAQAAGEEAVTAHVLADLASRPMDVATDPSLEHASSVSEVGPGTRPFALRAAPPVELQRARPMRRYAVASAAFLVAMGVAVAAYNAKMGQMPVHAVTVPSTVPTHRASSTVEPPLHLDVPAPVAKTPPPRSRPAMERPEHPKSARVAKRVHEVPPPAPSRWDSEAALPPP